MLDYKSVCIRIYAKLTLFREHSHKLSKYDQAAGELDDGKSFKKVSSTYVGHSLIGEFSLSMVGK